jgi:hypothetical protein
VGRDCDADCVVAAQSAILASDKNCACIFGAFSCGDIVIYRDVAAIDVSGFMARWRFVAGNSLPVEGAAPTGRPAMVSWLQSKPTITVM